MNPEDLKKFLSAFKDTDVEEFHLEAGQNSIFFRKSDVHPLPLPQAASHRSVPAEKPFIPIKSPMVGTFYHSDESDHPPFVIEGNHIVPGQKIGIIEAMKIIKNVTSSVTGKIVKVSVENGQSVEYGQELFLVDPEDEKSA